MIRCTSHWSSVHYTSHLHIIVSGWWTSISFLNNNCIIMWTVKGFIFMICQMTTFTSNPSIISWMYNDIYYTSKWTFSVNLFVFKSAKINNYTYILFYSWEVYEVVMEVSHELTFSSILYRYDKVKTLFSLYNHYHYNYIFIYIYIIIYIYIYIYNYIYIVWWWYHPFDVVRYTYCI